MTVAAITAVLGGQKILRRKVTSEAELTRMTRDGLPVGSLTLLANELSIERKVVAKIVGISDRTLNRRIASASRLSIDESDRMVRLARVVALATDTLGSIEKASRWLQKPNRALEGEVPLHLLDTDAGVRSVETILMRIEYGLYS